MWYMYLRRLMIDLKFVDFMYKMEEQQVNQGKHLTNVILREKINFENKVTITFLKSDNQCYEVTI